MRVFYWCEQEQQDQSATFTTYLFIEGIEQPVATGEGLSRERSLRSALDAHAFDLTRQAVFLREHVLDISKSIAARGF